MISNLFHVDMSDMMFHYRWWGKSQVVNKQALQRWNVSSGMRHFQNHERLIWTCIVVRAWKVQFCSCVTVLVYLPEEWVSGWKKACVFVCVNMNMFRVGIGCLVWLYLLWLVPRYCFPASSSNCLNGTELPLPECFVVLNVLFSPEESRQCSLPDSFSFSFFSPFSLPLL